MYILLSLLLAFSGVFNQTEVVIPETKENALEEEYEVVMARVTAYAPFDNKSGMCNNGDPTNTATMTYPKWGTLAVDPSKIPYGTKVYVPGYGYGIAEDTGGLIRSYEGIAIDLFMDTSEEIKEWGVKYIEVRVYK